MGVDPSRSRVVSPSLLIAYDRNAKAIGVLWATFTLCYCIVAVLVFLQPYWLGSTNASEQAGVFGLYQYCKTSPQTDNTNLDNCRGAFTDYDQILSPIFKISTVFVGISAIASLLCVLCMILFICVQPRIVFKLCACLQIISFVCISSGCALYPAGWDNPEVKRICGVDASKYSKGTCQIQWTYILAIVGVFDIFSLSILAFLLSVRPVDRISKKGDRAILTNVELPEQFHPIPTMFGHSVQQRQYGQQMVNGAIEHGEIISDVSTVLKPTNRARAQYAVTVQNFQL